MNKADSCMNASQSSFLVSWVTTQTGLGVRVGEEVEGGRMETTSFFHAFQSSFKESEDF